MKKLLLVLTLGFAAQASFAATSTDANAAGASWSITTANCPYLKADITVNLSKSVAGGISCDATGTAGAVATGNVKGKGVLYSGSTNGGALTETTTAVANITGANAITRAAAALSGS